VNIFALKNLSTINQRSFRYSVYVFFEKIQIFFKKNAILVDKTT